MRYPDYVKFKNAMAIRHRVVIKDHFYHIVQRAPGGEKLFVEKPDYECFLRLMWWMSHKYGIEIHGYALLTNHVHILCRIKEENLSDAMKSLFEAYALYFNQRYERIGHVFSGRFRSFICLDDNYLLNISVYIHLNPRKAWISDSAEAYPWSSLLAYKGMGRDSSLVTSHILGMLDKDLPSARSAYMKIIRERESALVPAGGRDPAVFKEMTNDERMATIEAMLFRGNSPREVMAQLGISRATYYRHLSAIVRQTARPIVSGE